MNVYKEKGQRVEMPSSPIEEAGTEKRKSKAMEGPRRGPRMSRKGPKKEELEDKDEHHHPHQKENRSF